MLVGRRICHGAQMRQRRGVLALDMGSTRLSAQRFLRRPCGKQPGGEIRQGGGDVAKDTHGYRIVFANLPRIGVEMDDRHALGQRLDFARQRQRKDIGADRDEQIMVLHRRVDRRAKPGQRPAIERMGGGEVAPAGDGFVIDRCAQRFGEGDDLGKGATLSNCVAHHQHGRFRLCHQGAGAGDRFKVAADGGADARWLAKVDFAFRDQHVARQREKYRTHRRRQRGFCRAVNHLRQIGE